MYKLMINDIFMTSVSMFRETLNKDGNLKLGFYKDVQGIEDIASIESLLSDLQTYVMEKSIKTVKILDNNDKLLFESSNFSNLDNAELIYDDSNKKSLNITIE